MALRLDAIGATLVAMELLSAGLAVLAFADLAAAAALAAKLKAARAALAASEARLAAPAPSPPRALESRREHYGLLWFPTLTVKEDEKLIVAAAAGLPHCPRCVKAMSLLPGASGEWVCGGCSERRPGTAADLQVTDSLVAETLKEFLFRHPDWRAAPGLGARGR